MAYKGCVLCGSRWHYQTFCPQKPRKPITRTRTLRKVGKIGITWNSTRLLYFLAHAPDLEPYPHYLCYLCGKWLRPPNRQVQIYGDCPLPMAKPYRATLDHVLPRSKRPDLRFVFTNLRVCCWDCNTEKGSKVLS